MVALCWRARAMPPALGSVAAQGSSVAAAAMGAMAAPGAGSCGERARARLSHRPPPPLLPAADRVRMDSRAPGGWSCRAACWRSCWPSEEVRRRGWEGRRSPVTLGPWQESCRESRPSRTLLGLLVALLQAESKPTTRQWLGGRPGWAHGSNASSWKGLVSSMLAGLATKAGLPMLDLGVQWGRSAEGDNSG